MADEEIEFGVLAAHITGAHGVTGNVKLRLVGTDGEIASRSLMAGRHVKALREGETTDEPRLLTLASLRRQAGPKGAWIAHFKEVTSRDDAQQLIGWALYVPEGNRPALPDDEYYVDQLLGLSLVTDTGHSLGELTEVITSPASDVYMTDTGVMVPAVAEYIISVDLERRTIQVRDVPGLRE